MVSKLTNRLPAKDPVSWSRRLLASRGFGVTPVHPVKGRRYLSPLFRPQLVASHRDGRCVLVLVARAADRFGLLVNLFGDAAVPALLYASDALYTVEVHCWGRDADGMPKVKVTEVSADDFAPAGQVCALLGYGHV